MIKLPGTRTRGWYSALIHNSYWGLVAVRYESHASPADHPVGCCSCSAADSGSDATRSAAPDGRYTTAGTNAADRDGTNPADCTAVAPLHPGRTGSNAAVVSDRPPRRRAAVSSERALRNENSRRRQKYLRRRRRHEVQSIPAAPRRVWKGARRVINELGPHRDGRRQRAPISRHRGRDLAALQN